MFSATDERPENKGQLSQTKKTRFYSAIYHNRKPRQADYQCSSCTMNYSCMVKDNSWYAVYKQECPHCHVTQFPRIDISLPINAIELDPNISALYTSYSDEDLIVGDDTGQGSINEYESCTSSDEDDTDELESDASVALNKEDSSKLLILMLHARKCTKIHPNPKQNEICQSVKFLMLHIRDCSGYDVLNPNQSCVFPWCKPCKRLLYHLTECIDGASCSICNPSGELPQSFQVLNELNKHVQDEVQGLL